MSEPRLRNAGDEFTIGGIDCRILEGRKKPKAGDGEDLMFQFRTPGGVWKQPAHQFAVALVHFMYENEEALYPSTAGFRGGRYFIDLIDEACGVGYPAAIRRLQQELRDVRPAAEDDEEDAA